MNSEVTPELEIINNEVVYSIEGLLNNLSIHTEVEHSPILELESDEEYIVEQIGGNIGTASSSDLLIESLSAVREPYSQRFYQDIIEAIVNATSDGLQTGCYWLGCSYLCHWRNTLYSKKN